MNMVKVTRIANLILNAKDVDAMVFHFAEVMGLTIVERGDDGNIYLSTGTDHHNVVLSPSKESGLRTLTFQIDSQYSLKETVGFFKQNGIHAEMKTDAQPAIPELIELSDIDGNLLHLYIEGKTVSPGYKNSGNVPNKLGHVALLVKNAKDAVKFYETFLGFQVSDWMGDFFCFMRCNNNHHTMNFLQSKKEQKMHHVAFELRDWSHIQTSTDLLSKHKKGLIWGPVRHGIGHNISTYHYDPDGNIVEFFAEMDIWNEELGYFEPRPWHREFPQKPKVWDNIAEAASLWGTMPPEGFIG
jgi:catechol-2,3-dioxygenase